MKKFLTVMAFILSVSSLYAGLAVPGEKNPLLSKARFRINGEKYTAEKTLEIKPEENSVYVTVKDNKGEAIWKSCSIGFGEKLTAVGKQHKSIIIKDIDGDKIPEILAGATDGANGSFLYVFKYDAAEKTFNPMNFTYPENKFSRAFLVSDIIDPSGNDVVVGGKGRIRAVGKIYSNTEGALPGMYFFQLEKGEFVCKATKSAQQLQKDAQRREERKRRIELKKESDAKVKTPEQPVNKQEVKTETK